MYRKNIFIPLLSGIIGAFSSTLCKDHVPTQPTQIFGEHVWHQAYQDQIVNNVIVANGHMQDINRRYAYIKDLASKFKRPITVLDIGASQGYYSLKGAYEFPDSTFVMIEEDRYLQRLCQLNTELDNIIFLCKRVTIEELQQLGSCEHFDIVLALNVIHWSEGNWKEMTDAVLALGDHVIIETPPAGDLKAIGAPYLGDIEQYIESKGGRVIDTFARNHTNSNLRANFYIVSNKKNTIERAHWNAAHDGSVSYRVKSTFKEKRLRKMAKPSKKATQLFDVEWSPGINLLTFAALNGVYPELPTIESALEELSVAGAPVKVPAADNLIIQGNAIVPVTGISSSETEHTIVEPHAIMEQLFGVAQ